MAGKHQPRDDTELKKAAELTAALGVNIANENLIVLNNILAELKEIKMHLNILTELDA